MTTTSTKRYDKACALKRTICAYYAALTTAERVLTTVDCWGLHRWVQVIIASNKDSQNTLISIIFYDWTRNTCLSVCSYDTLWMPPIIYYSKHDWNLVCAVSAEVEVSCRVFQCTITAGVITELHFKPRGAVKHNVKFLFDIVEVSFR